MSRPRVLCIDDEPLVLRGLALALRREFDVLTADGGAGGLAILGEHSDIAAIVCDMRMPRMDGAAVLARAREIQPNTSRILLTGQADIEAAIRAINDGQIFRFLTKPCSPDRLAEALRAAAHQHQLVTAEKEVLERTLRGAVEALVEILALVSPGTFGRAKRIAAHATRIATTLGVPDRWRLELAASLQDLGCVALPHETLEHVLPPDQVVHAHDVTEQLLAHIPRLDDVRAIQRAATRPVGQVALGLGSIELAGAILFAANRWDELDQQGLAPEASLAALRAKACHPALVLDAIASRIGRTRRVAVTLASLRKGMVLADDVMLVTGALFVPRGYEIGASFLAKLRNVPDGAIRQPVFVAIHDDDAEVSAAG
jgi:CheY-like chemotaxis protein|nr:response regulator [Kofleriaceae bacterium]